VIIADTGFFLAVANRRDRWHERAVAVLSGLSEPLVTTWLVVGEASHLFLRRLGVEAQLRFLELPARAGLDLVDLTRDDLPKAFGLMRRYADLPMDLADASLVLLAERLGHGRILSTDERDFGAYRWKNHEPFQNLLLPAEDNA
jgi:predicted nucleic acid-binding protein